MSCESIGRTLLLAGTLGLLAAPAFSQQSRADEIAQQQAEKDARLTPNTSTTAERALDWFEDHFADPTTLYLTFGEVYSSSGFAPGVAHRAALGRAPTFRGKEAATALLSNARQCAELLGAPAVSLDEIVAWTAAWLEAGGETLDKPTHFEVRDGAY